MSAFHWAALALETSQMSDLISSAGTGHVWAL